MSELADLNPFTVLEKPIMLLSVTGCNFTRLQPGPTRKEKVVHYLKAVYYRLVFVNILIYHVMQLVYLLDISGDLELFLKVLSSIILSFVPSWRAFVFWKNNRKILGLFDELAEPKLYELTSGTKNSFVHFDSRSEFFCFWSLVR
jgi:hypothetical protein